MVLQIGVAVLTFLIQFCTSSLNEPCSVPNATGYKNYSTFEYKNKRHYLYCNSESFDNIDWYHIATNSTNMTPYPFEWCDTSNCQLESDNQTIFIKELPPEATGTFICNVSCSLSRRFIINTIKFYVKECHPIDKPNVWGLGNASASLGQSSVSLSCRADTGCETDAQFYWERNKTFYTIDSIEKSNIKKNNITEHYRNVSFISTLIVKDITEDDYGEYKCYFNYIGFSGFFPPNGISVFLEKTDVTSDSSNMIWIFFVLVCLAFFVILAIILCLVFGPCIYYHCWQKRKIAKRELGKMYDTFIYHDDMYQNEAVEVNERLTGMGYFVCTVEDSDKESKIQAVDDLTTRSASIIFMCSRDDELMTTVLSEGVHEFNSHQLFVVIRKEYEKTYSNQINRSLAKYTKLKWPERNCITLSIGYKIARQNFYCRLKSGLPKPGTEDKTDDVDIKMNGIDNSMQNRL